MSGIARLDGCDVRIVAVVAPVRGDCEGGREIGIAEKTDDGWRRNRADKQDG